MNRKDINILVEEILFSPYAYSKKLCKTIIDDYDYFDNVGGVLKEENVKTLIQRSKKRKEISKILPKILYFSDEHTISDAIFTMLCSYPKKRYRNSLLTSIAHCKISFYQLHEICKRRICLEAFASLLDVYVENECFTVLDLQKLIEDNAEYLSAIDLKQVLKDYTSTGPKRNFLERLCSAPANGH